MAEIEFTIPTVQYGNIKVRLTPEELYSGEISPYDVGQKAVEWLVLVSMGRDDSEKIDFQPPHRFKAELPPGEPEAAARRLEEGKKPRTVSEDHEMAKQLIESELGATEIPDDAPPWEQPAPAKSEPWKQGSPTKKISNLF